MTRLPLILAALGWLALCAGLAMHWGTWLFVAGAGVGALLAGIFVMARDFAAEALVAYWTPAAGGEGSPPPQPETQEHSRRIRRWFLRG